MRKNRVKTKNVWGILNLSTGNIYRRHNDPGNYLLFSNKKEHVVCETQEKIVRVKISWDSTWAWR